MKKQLFYFTCVSALSLFIFSCTQDAPKVTTLDKKMACYLSVSGKDTAYLSIDTANKPIMGTLTFNYTDKEEIFDGVFKGAMRGDTLTGHFYGKTNSERPFNNPVAFLKKDGKLVMGVGQFMLVMGTAQFDNKVPIDYTKSRFIFDETACKD